MGKTTVTALIGLALGLLTASSGWAARNWADDDEAATDPAYAESRAICRATKTVTVPGAEGPVAEGCSSEALYDGLGGVAADPAAARRCAMGERADDPDNARPFAGTAMLMTIFANGRGAPRDLDVATSLACMLDGAPEEMDGRVRHLAALKADGPGATPFSICDDVTSGLSAGLCAAHDSRLGALRRNAALEALAAPWPIADRAALAAARQAAETFGTARGRNEIDLSGSARVAFQIEAEDAVRDDFLDLQQRLVAHRLPSVADVAAQDKALDTAFETVMAVPDPQWGTATKDGIRLTQRAWLVYRDAVSTFAAARYGAPAGAAVKAWLTGRRTAQLRPFAL